MYRLAPFGPSNPAPVLACRSVQLENVDGLGTSGAHTRLIIEDRDGIRVPVIWWRTPPEDVPSGRLDIAFTMGLDEYAGEPAARLVLVAVRSELVKEAVLKEGQPELSLAVEDRRGAPDRGQILWTLLQRYGEAIQVWAEGLAAQDMTGVRDGIRLEPGTDLSSGLSHQVPLSCARPWPGCGPSEYICWCKRPAIRHYRIPAWAGLCRETCLISPTR
jgi:hypothetical protein